MRLFNVNVFIIVALLTCVSFANADQSFPNLISSGKSILQVGKTPDLGLKSFSLLDPARFTMKQESIMSYSSGGGYGNNLMGMYINTMEYRFSIPLTMRLKLAYQNNMGGLIGNKSYTGGNLGIDTGRLYIPSFDMFYQPWKNTIFSFHYRDYSGTNPYNGYYGYSPYMRY